MTRGNQRDNDRKKAQKKADGAKSKNTMTGSEFQRAKEDNASIMRRKQEAANAKKLAEGGVPGKKKK